MTCKANDAFPTAPLCIPLRWLLIFCLLATLIASHKLARGTTREENKALKVGVVLSEPIKPYLDAVSSFKKTMEEYGIKPEVFEMKNRGTVVPKNLQQAVSQGDFRLWVGVGPQATEYLDHKSKEQRLEFVYGMVLNPEQILKSGCGVPMNIPIDQQLQMIKKVFPDFHRLGILYDPRYNQRFVEKASSIGPKYHLKVVPIPVSKRADIPRILNNSWDMLDALWLIPDFTVISESIVEYIVKEGLANRKVVVGYNKFFFKTGAAMSFILDYDEIGKQIALLCKYMLSSRNCQDLIPAFKVWINSRVLNILRIEIPRTSIQKVVIRP